MTIALPSYIEPDAWAGFEEMRRMLKKPLTDRARKMVLYELQRIKDAGHDPNAALDQSINHCWADVYPSKEKIIEAKASKAADATADYLAEQKRIADESRSQSNLEAKRAALGGLIRRVA